MSIPLILHTTPHHRLPVAVLLLWGLLLALPLQSTAAASSAPLAEPSADETSTDETSTGVAGTPLQRRPSFTHVDLPDGFLPDGDLAITQDADGFLWIGGPSGLYRYDGYRLLPIAREVAEAADGPSHRAPRTVGCRHVRDLVAMQRHLWIATRCGVERLSLDDESLTTWSVPSESGLRSVTTRLALDADGWLWVGTSDGLYWLDPQGRWRQRFERAALPQILQTATVTAVFLDRDRTVWVGTDEGLVHLDIEQQTTSVIPFADPVADPQHRHVENIHRDVASTLWVTTGDGLRRFEATGSSGGRMVLNTTLPALCSSTPQQWFYGLTTGGDGALWFSVGGGLSAWHPHTGEWECYSRYSKDPKGLGGAVGTLFTDAAGTLWAATERTLDRATSTTFTAWEYAFADVVADSGWKTSWSAAPLIDDAGHLWVGSNLGLFEIDPVEHRLIRHFMADAPQLLQEVGLPTVGNLPSFTVLTLNQGNDGSIWAGTAEGLGRLAPGDAVFEHVPIPASPNPMPRVRSIVPLDGGLWVGTTQGLFRRDEAGGEWTSIPLPRALGEATERFQARYMVADGSGRLWVGTRQHGLLMVPAGGQTLTIPDIPFATLEPLQQLTVTGLMLDPPRRLWVAYETAGFHRVDLNTLETTLPEWAQRLDGRYVKDMQRVDSDLWLLTQTGLTRLSRSDGRPVDAETAADGEVTMRHFGDRDGLAQLGFIFNILLHDQRLLATGASLYELDLESTQETTLPPVRWTDLQIFNQRQQPRAVAPQSTLQRSMVSSREVTLTPEQTVVTLELSALGAPRPEDLTYFYRLDDVDSRWRSTRPGRPYITYSHLPPGSYRLQARADLAGSPPPGDPLTEAVLELTVQPPLWRSPWAYLGYVSAAALLLWAWFSGQRRQLRIEQQVSHELRRLDRLKDEFLANTSHELRTPLFGMTGLAESLRQGAHGPVSPSVQNHLDGIVTSGRRLSTLLDDLLDFAHMRRRGSDLDLDVQSVPLHHLVNDAFELCRPQAEAHDVTLRNQVGQRLSPVRLDVARGLQILRHLIGNGIKFAPGGEVTVDAKPQDGRMHIEVRDNGIGFSDRQRQSIFNLFEQGDGTSTRGHGGAGLGLTMSKLLVERHGGTLHAESTPGQGARFFFTLPLSDQPPIELPPPSEAPRPAAPRAPEEQAPEERAPEEQAESVADDGTETGAVPPDIGVQTPAPEGPFEILIVDDEPVNQLILRGYLSADQFRTTTAADGPQALELLEQRSFDLILLDVMMPEMSGFEVCQTIRRDHSMETLPVLFVTAKHELADRLEGFAAGANDFLVKPIARDELVARVVAALTVSRRFKQATWELAALKS